MDGLQLHQHGGLDFLFMGSEIGVTGSYGGQPGQLAAVLFKFGHRFNQAGKCAADREFRDAVFPAGFHDGGDIFIPDHFGEVQQIAFGFQAVSVRPEHGGVDSNLADILYLVGDGGFKGFNLLHGVSLRACVSLNLVTIFYHICADM